MSSDRRGHTVDLTSSGILAVNEEVGAPLQRIIALQALLAETVLTEEQRAYVETIGESASALARALEDVWTPPQSSSELAPPVSLAGVRFLVVDESGARRAFVRDALVPHGARLEEGLDVNEALAHLDQARAAHDPFLLVLVDAGLANDDAATVIAALRARDDAHCVLFIEPSENATLVDNVHVSAIVKPLRRAELYDAVERVLDNAPVAIAKPPLLPVDLSGMHVLLVEDSPDGRLFVATVLTRANVFVDDCSSGEEALARLKGGYRYDLILMDVEMPGLNGRDTTRAIRAYERAESVPRTPILALTAHRAQADIDRCFDAGCDGHVGKPVGQAELLEIVEREARRAGFKPSPSSIIGQSSVALLPSAAFTAAPRHSSMPQPAPRPTPRGPPRADTPPLDVDPKILESLREARSALLRGDLRALELISERLKAVPGAPAETQALLDAIAAKDRAQVREALRVLSEVLQLGGRPPSSVTMDVQVPEPVHHTPFDLSAAIASLVPEFRQRRREDVVTLRQAVRDGDLKQVVHLGHRMAGTGASYGEKRVSELGAALEAAGERGALAEIGPLLDELQAYLDSVT